MKRPPEAVVALAAAARRRIWLARAALLWERLWPALWPAVFIAGFFLATALFDVWTLAPGWLHALGLALLGLAFGAALIRGLSRLTFPGEEEALRRLERNSGLAHRPLGALRDRPSAGLGDRTTEGLWNAHLARSARRAGRLRVGLASPGLARRDPLGLRAALLLVLVIAVAAAGGNAGSRLAHAVTPDFSAFGAGGPAELTLWITPPAYTGAAPVFVATGAETTTALSPVDLTVPSGSAVLARVHGGRGAPSLMVDETAVPFDVVDSANYELRDTLREGRRLAVVQNGRELGAWPLTVLADQPPGIEFARPPARTQRGALRLDYLAEDDYGLVAVEVTVRRADAPDQSFTVPLPLPRNGARTAEETSYHDFTPHPWAGLEVTLTLGATDALGQRGLSDPLTTVLPERIFNHPVARALIEQRRILTLDPSKRAEVSRALDEISRRPEHFFEDLNVFLGLRAARWRLLYDRSETTVPAVQDLLWDLALTIEDGPLALAERDLREAQKALLEALDRDAPEDEIERLIDRLLAKLDDFLDALTEQAESRRDIDPGLEEQMAQEIQRKDLTDIIERARELYRTGARDAARELLSQLQEMIENLRAGRFAGADRQGMSEGEAAMQDLEGLLKDQQGLLDRTFRWSQGNGEMRRGGPADRGYAEQEALRRRLGDLMLRWGQTGLEIPRPLGRAERAMRDAGRALGENRPGQAVGPQTRAVDQMQQGAQAMLDAMLAQMGRAPPRPGQGLNLFGQRDPLGRGLMGRGYQNDGSRTKVPDEADLQRSREILDELYRRAGDFKRPPIERNYIRRLLRRF
ncbi:MAG: TIGR02302 family protein [Alphaproteobacteria bacterium]